MPTESAGTWIIRLQYPYPGEHPAAATAMPRCSLALPARGLPVPRLGRMDATAVPEFCAKPTRKVRHVPSSRVGQSVGLAGATAMNGDQSRGVGERYDSRSGNVRANLRRLVKRILRKHGYPPDKQEKATRKVLEQAEVLSSAWAA